tara:strand:+ start:300 stop:596 length:297 start_codon:yes stop_codon:yes gene_type:complete
MKRVFKFYYLCKVLIFFLVAFIPIEVFPKKYGEVYKNFNDEKFIDARDYSEEDKFLIKNNKNNFISSFRKTRGKFFVRINQLFLIIILIIIFIAVLEI